MCSPFSTCDTPGLEVNHMPKRNLVYVLRLQYNVREIYRVDISNVDAFGFGASMEKMSHWR